jgi:hypothetical protein
MGLVFLRVRPVEGRMVLDPFSIGAVQHRRIGYEREVEGRVSRNGIAQPRVRYRFVGGEVVVRETTDGYFRRAILDGDLEYLETIHEFGIESERRSRDPSLLAATAANIGRRGAPEQPPVELEATPTTSRLLQSLAAGHVDNTADMSVLSRGDVLPTDSAAPDDDHEPPPESAANPRTSALPVP